MATYNFDLLDPRPAGAEKNDEIFAREGGVFGIEVTIPTLAERCGLGNLDPQHSGQDASTAAIEAALTCELPPKGATLVTVRADLDAVGAMAVFGHRAYYDEVHGWGTSYLSDALDTRAFLRLLALYDRVKMVAVCDKFAYGAWVPRPLPTEENPWDDPTASVEGNRALAAIEAAVADFKIPLKERVAWVRDWLCTGAEPDGYREKVEAERQDLIAALGDGRITAEAVNGIATVVSTHRAATSVGYSLAPVVVALNPEFCFGGGEPHQKFTVCQFDGTHVDLQKVLAELAELESGWGGSPTIGGSPQGASSNLTMDQVVEVVRRHLK
jgi:hypothetical protein